MTLTLEPTLKIGVNTMNRRIDPGEGPWLPKIDALSPVVQRVERPGDDGYW